MTFTYESDPYFDMILDMAYEKYCTEVSCHSFQSQPLKRHSMNFFRKN